MSPCLKCEVEFCCFGLVPERFLSVSRFSLPGCQIANFDLLDFCFYFFVKVLCDLYRDYLLADMRQYFPTRTTVTDLAMWA